VADAAPARALDEVDAAVGARDPLLGTEALKEAQKDVQDVVVLCCNRGEDLRDKCALRVLTGP